jgi:hypothetical protein
MEKKLAKMNPEHKDRPVAIQRLNDLRQEMVGMENAVLNEDARFVWAFFPLLWGGTFG